MSRVRSLSIRDIWSVYRIAFEICYPQSNGKTERWHNSLKGECIRPRNATVAGGCARRLVDGYVEDYNDVRLDSAIGYIMPKDMLAGGQQEIHAERDRKLEEARN